MANRRELRNQIQNPAGYPTGTTIDEFWDGTKELTHPDGKKEPLSKDNTSLKTTIFSDMEKFVADLQKDPKNRLLQEYAKAYLTKVKYIEDDKTTAKDLLDKIAELSGALQPENTGMKMPVILIQVNAPGQPFQKQPINITAQPK